ncbi:MAG: DUF4395 domain-containing protein [Actinomycetota bacterium]
MKPVTMIDPRQPRLGQGITGVALLVGFLLDQPLVLPVLAVILAAASLGGPGVNPYALLFRGIRAAGWIGPPRELEEAAPPRFSNTLGLAFLTAASLAYYLPDQPLTWLAWGLGLLVSALALLAGATGLCVGCELYVFARRIATRGRVARRITRPVERAAA